MNASRTDHRRQLDFSALKDPESLTRAIGGLLSRRSNAMTENDIAKWFRATPEAFVHTQLVLMAGRGQVKTRAGARGVTYYWTNNYDE